MPPPPWLSYLKFLVTHRPSARWPRYISYVGFFSPVAAVLIYGFQVWMVYAAYFDHRVLGASPAVGHNLWRKGKRFLATPFFLGQWRHYVLGPRSAIECHFAWMKRYFDSKYFQCYNFVRLSQFVLLTYIATAAVALAAQRYNRPNLVRSRCAVLAHARPRWSLRRLSQTQALTKRRGWSTAALERSDNDCMQAPDIALERRNCQHVAGLRAVTVTGHKHGV